MTKVRWGLLSTASIGRVVTEATRRAKHAELVAVASRDVDRARRFADELGLGASFGSYEELLASDDVDAIYVALPVSMHTEWTIKSLEAGKHVLCEKPFAITPEDAARCFDAAASAGKLCAEGLMYRHHPQTALARTLVTDGGIGRLAHVRAAFECQRARAVRCGPGPASDLPRRDELELVGTDGKLTVPDPWLCRPGYIELERDGQSERLPVDPSGTFGLAHPDYDAYRIELDTVSAAITGEGQ